MIKNSKKTYLLVLVLLSATIFIFRDVEDTPFHMRLLATLDATKVSTTSTRTTTVQEFCTTSKANLISDAERTTNTQYFSIMKTYFKADITSMIGDALNGDMDSVVAAAKEQASTLGIYIAPFIIGLLLSVTLWAFLCCCCTCPSCCPSKCCQHDENILYTKCELLWPAIVLVVLLGLAIGASVPGIMQASKLSDSITTMQCGVGLMLDDLLNGNITTDETSFFSGTNTLVALLSQLNTTVDDINSNFTNVKTSVTNVKTNANTVRSNIETLGLSGSNNSFSLTYTDPTPAGSSYTADSSFSAVLGNPTIANTLSYGLYSVIDTLYTEMTSIEDSITTFNTATSGGDIKNQITEAVNQFSPINTQINDLDTTVYDMFATASPILQYLKLGVLVFFAVSIGLASIIALGAIFTAFCEMPKCRFLMYVFCILTVVIIVLGFLITTVFAIMSPILYMGCTVLNSGLESQTGFNTFTTNIGLGSNDVTNIVSVCLTGGNGEILEALGVAQIDDLNNNLANMSTIMSGFTSYANFDTSAITTGASNVSTQIGYFADGKINDIFTTASALSYFANLANGSYYSSCADANFLADSLVPSTDSQSTSYVACSKSSLVTCTQSSDTFLSLANGCIDLTSCFPNYDYNSGGTIATDFSNRYPACPTIGTDIYSVYTNWDKKRRDTSTGITAVKNKYDTDVKDEINNNLITSIDDLKNNCTSAVSAVQTLADSLTNPTYGLIAGLNCRVIGEDLVIAKDTVCVSFFNSIYFLLLTVGITSFAFLFAICCVTCTGVRHYKQEQTKQKIGAVHDNNGSFYEQTAMHLNQQSAASNGGYPGGGYPGGGYSHAKNAYP